MWEDAEDCAVASGCLEPRVGTSKMWHQKQISSVVFLLTRATCLSPEQGAGRGNAGVSTSKAGARRPTPSEPAGRTDGSEAAGWLQGGRSLSWEVGKLGGRGSKRTEKWTAVSRCGALDSGKLGPATSKVLPAPLLSLDACLDVTTG